MLIQNFANKIKDGIALARGDNATLLTLWKLLYGHDLTAKAPSTEEEFAAFYASVMAEVEIDAIGTEVLDEWVTKQKEYFVTTKLVILWTGTIPPSKHVSSNAYEPSRLVYQEGEHGGFSLDLEHLTYNATGQLTYALSSGSFMRTVLHSLVINGLIAESVYWPILLAFSAICWRACVTIRRGSAVCIARSCRVFSSS